MSKLFTGLLLITFIFVQACEGPAGPPGEDGVNIMGEALEVEVDFTSENGYQAIFDLNPPIFDSDVVIAFIEWEMVNGSSMWRQLPQVVYHEEGLLQYNFDFTVEDFSLFLNPTFDPGLLEPQWTDNQYFRIVIVPADFVGKIKEDTEYEEVMEMMGISDEDFKPINAD